MMTLMELDLRKPSFVIVGAWNPAIFKPSWCARYLLNIPEGQDVSGAEVMAVDPNSSPVFYIKNTGFRVSNQRADIFLNSRELADVTTTEVAVENIVRILPHTPLGPFGINFSFIEREPEPELLDKLKSTETIDQHFRIINQSFTTGIALEEGVILNLSRNPTEDLIVIEFNYHHEKIEHANFHDVITGKYSEYLTRSLGILETLYGITGDYEIINHNFDEAQQNQGVE